MVEQSPRWRRNPEKRPDQVLAAALAEFRQRGFAGTRVDDIAARAGLSKGTLYRYFASKEAMLKALIQNSVEPIVAQMENFQSTSNAEPLEIIEAMPALLVAALSNPDILSIPRLVVAEAGNFPEIAAYYRAAVIERAKGNLKKSIIQAIDSGKFRPVDPEIAARCIIGPVLAHMILSHVLTLPGQTDIPPRNFISGYLDILENGLLAKPSNESGGKRT